MAKILLIEDDANIAHLLSLQLKQRGHQVDLEGDGSKAYLRLQHDMYDLFLIDRMLPGLDGVTLCRKIRNLEQYHNSPIIFVTALSRSDDVVEGLHAGADDYITKPYDIDVLEARMLSVLRRYQILANSKKVFSVGDLLLDCEKHLVQVEGETIHLTNSEYRILVCLMQNGRKVLSRESIVTYVQGEKIHVTERTIDTHIASLRKKLKSASSLIETIRGVGYRVTCE